MFDEHLEQTHSVLDWTILGNAQGEGDAARKIYYWGVDSANVHVNYT